MKTKLIVTALFLCMTSVVASASTANRTNIDSLINSQIETRYKDAIILEVQKESGNIEVEIIHKQKEKDLIFSAQGVWESTKYDLLKSELPKSIKEAIEKSKFSSYSIDDVEVIETPTRSLYEIELEKWFSDDITIYITFDGRIL